MTSPFPKESQSPFDRKPQSPFTSGQPPSFKTNVNRAKTKKWVEAKAYSYEGDDWGDYDENDEYGVESAPPLPKPTGLRQRGQSIEQQATGGRSFTNPAGMPSQDLHRSGSFERGDERRTFSAGTQPPQGYGDFPQMPQQNAQFPQQPRDPGGAPLQVQTDVTPRSRPREDSVAPSSSVYSGASQSAVSESQSSMDPTHRRDFSPSAMPAPLRTPQPGTPLNDTPTTHFPPRKSSLSQPNSPTSPVAASPKIAAADAQPRQQSPSSSSKPLPFIRPADIYKRMEEERARERASMESGRPSMDSILRPGEDSRSGTPRERTSLDSVREEGGSSTPNSHLRTTPLATVAERKSEYGLPAGSEEAQPTSLAAAPSTQPTNTAQRGPPTLPQLSHESDFGNGFWGSSSNQATERPAAQQYQEADSGLQHQPSLGFRSVVEQAFDRPDDPKSVPETPVSKQSSLRSPDATGSDVSRSNTNSTAGISPIMSRVPSVGAAAAAKSSNSQIPPIDLTQTPAIAEEPVESSRHSFGTIPRKPSPSHSRDPSAGSATYIPGYRRGLNTPPSRGSPARSPAIEAQKGLPEPEVGQLSIETAESVEAAADKRPESPAKSRSQSPSKNRVQELAGRFDDFAESNSRRNSSHSLSSRGSWKQGAETFNAPEQRPPMESQHSFRPKLPGQWESFATTRADSTPNESDVERESRKDEPTGLKNIKVPGEPAVEDIDLTPTTSRHPLPAREARDKSPALTTNPMAALAAAGTAMGEAIKTSVGMGDAGHADLSDSDAAAERNAVPREPDHPASTKRETGNIFGRPPAPDRMESGVSSIPPTPPPKDSRSPPLDRQSETESSAEDMPPPAPLKGTRSASGGNSMAEGFLSTPARPTMLPQLSTDTALDDDETDKLRKDIVRTLSPVKDAQETPQNISLEVPGQPASNRDSDIIPSEYDTYWEGARPDGSRYSQMPGQVQVGPQGVEMADGRPDIIPEEPSPPSTQTSSRPGLLDKRFSWERSRDSRDFGDMMAPDAPGAAAGSSAVQGAAHEDTPEQFEATEGHRSVPEISTPMDEPPKPSSPPAITPERVMSPPTRGLHVINSTGLEEAVDVPPRLASPHIDETDAPEVAEPLTGEPLAETEPIPVDEKDFTAELTQEPTASSATQKQRLLPFREIAAIPNPTERIKSFNSTREQFATMDTGLQGWLSSTMTSYPEHNNLLTQKLTLTSRPTSGPSGRTGHRPTPSLSKFTNMLSPTSPQQSQNLDSATMTQGSSPSSGPSAPSSGQRPGAKMGKDLLNSAGALGGKAGALGGRATTVGKGLFAKGRSKFRSSGGGDKVD